MKKMKKLCQNNSVVRFLISYVLVLIIPLATLLYGFKTAFEVVEKNNNQSSVFVLKQAIAKIDEEVNTLYGISMQMAQSPNLKDFADKTVVNSNYSKQALNVIEEYYNTFRYQGISIIKNNYIHLKARDIILYENSIYHPDIFERYLKQWNISLKEWRDMCNNGNSRKPNFYLTSKGSLNYVLPFAKELRGENLGALIYEIDKSSIHNYLNFLDEYEQYSVFILDTGGNIIYEEDKLGYAKQLKKEWLGGNGILNFNNESIIYNNSEIEWQYILVLPQQVALEQLNNLERFVTILIFSAITAGLMISLFLSLYQGRPLNTLFSMIMNSKSPIQKNISLASVGKAVTEILKNNESLLEELENDKQYLKKAFFHNLVKAEFVNTTELNYMAKKAGIELKECHYCVISFKIFSNNDFYEVDEQTLEEVRIITQLVMNYLNEKYDEPVWFYKRNTLVTLGIFNLSENRDKDTLINLLWQTCDWLLKEYSVETNWGISSICKNLLDIWKNCEEAALAMEACQDSRHITEYSFGLEKAEEFYFPYIVEEKMAIGMKSGDWDSIKNMLGLLEVENFVRRSLDRSRFIKFHRRMTELLSQQKDLYANKKEKIYWLNETVIDYKGEYKEYFVRLRNICREICSMEQQKRSNYRKQVISEIMAYIKGNYMDSGLGLSKVGAEFGMSEGYLSTIFKEGAGVNFAEFLEQIRMEAACKLLKNADIAVCQVAERIGYNSIQSFRRAFKRVKGVSPKEFRG